MFALVRIDVAGRTFRPPRELAAETEPPSEAALRVERSWFGPDGSLFFVLDGVENPEGLSLLAAAAVNGSPMRLAGMVRPNTDTEFADDFRVILGRSRPDVMCALPPGYANCTVCLRDLSIEDHDRPPC